MKREIKFRAWDKKYNLMERGLFGLCSDGLVYSNSGPDNVVLMQFTGLKDKNGKEIYEGDIVLVSLPIPNSDIPALVKFNDGCFDIEGPLIKRDYLKCWSCNHAVEVIGNIYENPELLK